MKDREWEVVYYKNLKTNKVPVREYIDDQDQRTQAKIFSYITKLRDCKGHLDEPYSRHIRGKLRELRIDFSKKHHRIFYFLIVGKTIVLLHAFLKRTPKTPSQEIKRAFDNYYDYLAQLK